MAEAAGETFSPGLANEDSRRRSWRDLPGWARPLYGLSHPVAIFPIGIPVALTFGRYTPEQVTGLQEVPLFLQGNTDWGGSNLFAATVACYVVFGILGALWVTFRMRMRPRRASFGGALRANLRDLRWHLAAFLLFGTIDFPYDRFVGPNDFRDMFLWAFLLYGLSLLLVTGLGRSRLPLAGKLALAPLLVYGWLWLGWDGNTAKAGQILASGQDPAVRPRSARHRVMLAWHEACDHLFGDL